MAVGHTAEEMSDDDENESSSSKKLRKKKKIASPKKKKRNSELEAAQMNEPMSTTDDDPVEAMDIAIDMESEVDSKPNTISLELMVPREKGNGDDEYENEDVVDMTRRSVRGSPSRRSILRDSPTRKSMLSEQYMGNSRKMFTEKAYDCDNHEDRGPIGGVLDVWRKCKHPTPIWTSRHSFYFIIFGTIIPTAVCFAVNFGVACAVFMGKPSPTLWSFPIPIAGNYFAIIAVQTIINFPLAGSLVQFDILNGLSVSLLPAFWPSFPDLEDSNFLGWFLQPPELLIAPRDDVDKPLSKRLIDTFKRIGFWIVICFTVLWPLFTGITYAIWGDSNYNSFPQPEYMSAVLGGLLALLTCPMWAILVKISMGKRIHEERALAGEEGLAPYNAVQIEMDNVPDNVL